MDKKIGIGLNLLEVMAGCTLCNEMFYSPFPEWLSLPDFIENLEYLPPVGLNTLVGILTTLHGLGSAISKVGYLNSLAKEDEALPNSYHISNLISSLQILLVVAMGSSAIVARDNTAELVQELEPGQGLIIDPTQINIDEFLSVIVNQHLTAGEVEALRGFSLDTNNISTMNQTLENLVLVGSNCFTSQGDFGGSGQGILLTAEGHILVPYHVLTSTEESFCDRTDRYIITQQGSTHTIESVLAVDRVHDLAIAHSSYRSEHFNPPRFASSAGLVRGRPYTAAGLWLEEPPQIDCRSNGERSLANWNSVGLRNFYATGTFEGTGTLVTSNGYRPAERLRFRIYSQPGFSGSVMTNENGLIYAMIVGGSSTQEYLSAVSSDHIARLINAVTEAYPSP